MRPAEGWAESIVNADPSCLTRGRASEGSTRQDFLGGCSPARPRAGAKRTRGRFYREIASLFVYFLSLRRSSRPPSTAFHRAGVVKNAAGDVARLPSPFPG